MKKITFIMIAALALNACKSKTTDTNNADTSISKAEVSNTTPDSVANNIAVNTGAFDINKVPVSDKDLGKFPYLSPPDNYAYDYKKEIDPASISDMDQEYFAVNGKLIAQQGKTYKVRIDRNRGDGKRFNSLEVGEYYDKLIKGLGGVQVNSVTVPKAQIDSVGDNELIRNKYGHSIDYNLLDDIKTYVIRTNTKQIWIQMTLMNEEIGKITVLEK